MKIQNHTARFLTIHNRNTVERLYDRYGGALYNIILKMVCSRDLAQKVMEETFLKVCRQNPDCDDSKGRLFPWILHIARSTAMDALATVQKIGVEPLLAETDNRNPHVSRIDNKCKELIDLTYFKGYTQRETSEEMNIPMSSIKTQLRFAISEIRRSLEESSVSAKSLYPMSN